MTKVKKDYSEFISIVSGKALQIFEGEVRMDHYQLLAIDGPLTYECLVKKDGGSDQSDYESSYRPAVTARLSEQPDWDDFIVTFPTTVQELHTYKKNNIVVQTVLTTYSSGAKSQIIRIQKTRV